MLNVKSGSMPHLYAYVYTTHLAATYRAAPTSHIVHHSPAPASLSFSSSSVTYCSACSAVDSSTTGGAVPACRASRQRDAHRHHRLPATNLAGSAFRGQVLRIDGPGAKVSTRSWSPCIGLCRLAEAEARHRHAYP